jgi:hypothetical protein
METVEHVVKSISKPINASKNLSAADIYDIAECDCCQRFSRDCHFIRFWSLNRAYFTFRTTYIAISIYMYRNSIKIAICICLFLPMWSNIKTIINKDINY